jgi:WD40 repeat protein
MAVILPGMVQLWKVSTGKRLLSFRVARGSLRALAFSPDGKTLATGGDDGIVRLWDAGTGKQRTALREVGTPVFCVAFSPDGKLIAAGGLDNAVTLWDVATAQSIALLEGHTGSVTALTFRPDGRVLASASFDETVKLWELATFKERATFRGHNGPVWSVAFSPNGKLLACAGRGGVKLRDVASGSAALMTSHPEAMRCVAFSLGGEWLALAANDGTMRLWDVRSGKEKTAWQWQFTTIHSLAFSPGGKTLASDSGGDVYLWDVATVLKTEK